MSFFKDLFNDFTTNTLNKSIYNYLDQYFDDLNKLNYNYSSIEFKEINQINNSFSSLIKLILLNEKPVNCVGELSSSEKELLLVHLISLYETFLFKQAETTNISFLKLVFEQIQELKNISQQFSFNKINQDSLNYILFVSKIIQYKVNLIEDKHSSKSMEMKDHYLSKLYIILSSLDLSEEESFDLLNKFFSRYYEKSFLFFNSKTSIKLMDSFKFFFNDLIVENKLDKVIYFNHVLNQLRLLNEDYYKVILPENDFYLSIKKELLNEEEMLVILPYIKDKTILQLIENSNYSHLLTSFKDTFSEKDTFFRKIKQLKLQKNSIKTDKEILFCDYDVLFELGVLTNTSIKDYVFQNFCLNSQLIPLSDYIELDSVEDLLFVLENNQLSSFIKVPYSVREKAVEYLKKMTKTYDGEHKLICDNGLIEKLAYFLMLNENISFNFFHKYEFFCNPFSILMLKSLGIKKLSQLIKMQIEVKIRSSMNEEPLKHSYYFKDFLDFDLNNPKISALERKIILKGQDRNAFISADKGSNQYNFYQNLIKEIQSLFLEENKNKEKINKLVNLIKFNCYYDKDFKYGIYHEKVLLSLKDFLNLKEDNIWFSNFSIEKKVIDLQLEENKLKKNLNLNLNFSQYYILPQIVFIDFDLGKYGNETFKENLLNLFTGKTLNLSLEQKLILILNHLDQLKSLDLFNSQSLNLTEEDLIFINKLSVLKWSVFQYENVINFINYLKNIENYTTNENSEFNFNKKEKEILKNLMTQHSIVFKMFNI